MATIPFGNIGEFDPDKEEWSQYATRLRYFFAANGTATEDTKKAMLLTVVGPATFKTLRSLVSPASVDDKTYKQLGDVSYNIASNGNTLRGHQTDIPFTTRKTINSPIMRGWS